MFKCKRCGELWSTQDDAKLCEELHDYVKVYFSVDPVDDGRIVWYVDGFSIWDLEDDEVGGTGEFHKEWLDDLVDTVVGPNDDEDDSGFEDDGGYLQWSVVCKESDIEAAKAKIREAVEKWASRILEVLKEGVEDGEQD